MLGWQIKYCYYCDLIKKKNKDIIINFNEVGYKNNLKLFKSRFDKLWVHGLVHLFGHDHKSEKDFKKMKRVEIEYLKNIK